MLSSECLCACTPPLMIPSTLTEGSGEDEMEGERDREGDEDEEVEM